MTIDHTSVNAPESKFDACLAIYLAGLEPLGYEKRMQFGPTRVGLGHTDAGIQDYTQSNFWVIGVPGDSTHPVHVAFRAKSRAAVDAFYAAAIKAGAKDNGAPGVRSFYHPKYYAAFVLDAAGNNLEVVCHDE